MRTLIPEEAEDMYSRVASLLRILNQCGSACFSVNFLLLPMHTPEQVLVGLILLHWLLRTHFYSWTLILELVEIFIRYGHCPLVLSIFKLKSDFQGFHLTKVAEHFAHGSKLTEHVRHRTLVD